MARSPLDWDHRTKTDSRSDGEAVACARPERAGDGAVPEFSSAQGAIRRAAGAVRGYLNGALGLAAGG
jgi:hypothetical protein